MKKPFTLFLMGLLLGGIILAPPSVVAHDIHVVVTGRQLHTSEGRLSRWVWTGENITELVHGLPVGFTLGSRVRAIFGHFYSYTGTFMSHSDLNNLYIRDPVTNLNAAMFSRLSSVTNLAITSTSLTNLPAGIFDSLSNLETLSIESRSITNLPAGIFDSLSNLKTLTIKSYGSLTTLPAGLFDSISRDRTRLIIDFVHLLPLPDEITITPTILEVTEGSEARFAVEVGGNWRGMRINTRILSP